MMSFIVDMHLDGSNYFLEKTQECCLLHSLMVRWTSNSASIEPNIPCKGTYSSQLQKPIAPLTSHMLPTFQQYPEENRQLQHGL